MMLSAMTLKCFLTDRHDQFLHNRSDNSNFIFHTGFVMIEISVHLFFLRYNMWLSRIKTDVVYTHPECIYCNLKNVRKGWN